MRKIAIAALFAVTAASPALAFDPWTEQSFYTSNVQPAPAYSGYYANSPSFLPFLPRAERPVISRSTQSAKARRDKQFYTSNPSPR